MSRRLPCVLPVLFLILAVDRASLAADLDVRMADPELELVSIDSDPKESFLAVHLDTTGRIFVGCREAVFVYEPDEHGGYRQRQELVRFPPHSWVYDLTVRGRDLYALTITIKQGATVEGSYTWWIHS